MFQSSRQAGSDSEFSLGEQAGVSLEFSESFAEEWPCNNLPKHVPNITKIVESKKATNYYWTDAEHKRYLLALKKYEKFFEMSPQERRLSKTNVRISRMVRTRTALQCHSHHQKMVQKYGSIAAVLQQLDHYLQAQQRRPALGDKGAPKPKGRPRKIPLQTKDSETEVSVAASPVEAEQGEDGIYDVLELSRKDLQQRQIDRFEERQMRAQLEEEEMILLDVWP